MDTKCSSTVFMPSGVSLRLILGFANRVEINADEEDADVDDDEEELSLWLQQH